MNIRIKNETEFIEAIDAYGDLTANIEKLKSEAKIAKVCIEIYANENKITRKAGERYRLLMKKGTPALRRLAGVTDADVVALLEQSEIGKNYIIPTYDSDAIKHDFGGNSEVCEQLAEFGLMMTNPKRLAKVTAI